MAKVIKILPKWRKSRYLFINFPEADKYTGEFDKFCIRCYLIAVSGQDNNIIFCSPCPGLLWYYTGQEIYFYHIKKEKFYGSATVFTGNRYL